MRGVYNYTNSNLKKKKKEWMKNIESNYVKDVTIPIYGCPEIRSKYTEEHTRQISNFILPPAMQLLIKK